MDSARTVPATKTKQAAVQVGRFGLVGVLNTLIDYVIFISLTRIFSIPLSRVWIAKFFSGAVAMINSYYFNRGWVFHAEKGEWLHQAVKFVSTTVVGVFVIQLGLTQLLSSNFPGLGHLAFQIIDRLGIVGVAPHLFTQSWTIKTVAFGVATLASLTWNFFTYKFWAFRERR